MEKLKQFLKKTPTKCYHKEYNNQTFPTTNSVYKKVNCKKYNINDFINQTIKNNKEFKKRMTRGFREGNRVSMEWYTVYENSNTLLFGFELHGDEDYGYDDHIFTKLKVVFN